jgi:hypothetical protein
MQLVIARLGDLIGKDITGFPPATFSSAIMSTASDLFTR